MTRKLFALLFLPATCFAQNTGIGIAPTKAKLEIKGAVGNNVAIFGGDGAGISLQQNWPAIGFNQYYNAATYNMVAGGGWVEYLDMNNGSFNMDVVGATFSPNSQSTQVRRMTIRQNGNVSIDAGEANASLFVGNPVNGLPAAILRGTQYNSLFYEQAGVNLPYRNTYINAGKAGAVVLLNDKLGGNLLLGYTNGNVKVGINTDPTDIFEVKQYNGRGLALINPSFNYWELFVEKNFTENASDMYVYYNGGNLGNFYQGDGKYYYYSDKRVKNNVQPVTSALTGILQLKPSQYEIKFDNPGHLQSIGLIAQEARLVFPEITGHIEGDDLGYGGLKDLYTIDYNALGPLAIRAIQEQQLKVDQLKAQVTNIQQRIDQAQRLLDKKQQINTAN
ncbi:MAG: tail fiber domain-containing protein [Bacteroidota bacterium]